ncbi:MAG: hypothetical protein K2Y14_00905 [Burkholderiales bacterium]|nr:hypothetical protein [Burkholderiales bacterium]
MKKFIAMIVIAITLGACSKSAGDNYVGTWVLDEGSVFSGAKPTPSISITKSGTIYIVKDIGKAQIVLGPCSGGATLKEDTKLYCQPAFSFGYDENTHKLLSPLGSFSKQQ